MPGRRSLYFKLNEVVVAPPHRDFLVKFCGLHISSLLLCLPKASKLTEID